MTASCSTRLKYTRVRGFQIIKSVQRLFLLNFRNTLKGIYICIFRTIRWQKRMTTNSDLETWDYRSSSSGEFHYKSKPAFLYREGDEMIFFLYLLSQLSLSYHPQGKRRQLSVSVSPIPSYHIWLCRSEGTLLSKVLLCTLKWEWHIRELKKAC